MKEEYYENSEGKRFMFDYIPEMFAGEYATTEEEAARWLEGDDTARRPPELLTRDVVARSILSEVKAGRGSKHNGAYLDIANQRPADYIKKKLPSMYHQFKTLASLDITTDPMEVGPTTHYIMGGIRVNPETQSTNIEGLYAAGEVSAGLHGANRLGGNSLSDLLVFGKLAGDHATEYTNSQEIIQIQDADIKEGIKHLLGPFEEDKNENPYEIHKELKLLMGEYVGIIRNEENLNEGIKRLEAMLAKTRKCGASKGRKYNPGWHQALDIENMVISGLLLAHGALARKESRGGHTRTDFPNSEKSLERLLYIQKPGETSTVEVIEEKMSEIPDDLLKIIEEEGKMSGIF